jgi:hypothetical protein
VFAIALKRQLKFLQVRLEGGPGTAAAEPGRGRGEGAAGEGTAKRQAAGR